MQPFLSLFLPYSKFIGSLSFCCLFMSFTLHSIPFASYRWIRSNSGWGARGTYCAPVAAASFRISSTLSRRTITGFPWRLRFSSWIFDRRITFRALDRTFCQRLLNDLLHELLLDELLVSDVVDAFEAFDADRVNCFLSVDKKLSLGCVLSKHSFWCIMFAGQFWFVFCSVSSGGLWSAGKWRLYSSADDTTMHYATRQNGAQWEGHHCMQASGCDQRQPAHLKRSSQTFKLGVKCRYGTSPQPAGVPFVVTCEIHVKRN